MTVDLTPSTRREVISRPRKRDFFPVDDPVNAKRRLQYVTAQWLEEWAIWRLYVTLTFDDYVSPNSALKSLKKWLRAVAKEEVRRHFKVAVSMETTRAGVWHFHALLALPDDRYVSRKTLSKLWRSKAFNGGFTDIKEYRRGGGAAAYIVKGEHWMPEVICHRPTECRHKRGCIEAGGAWRFDYSK